MSHPFNAEQLRVLIEYSPETGEFVWKVSPGKNTPIGSVAGSITSKGYRVIKILGRRLPAARLAWLYVHGEWPPELMDHRNGVRDDDRIANLRPCTNSENGQNRKEAYMKAKKQLHSFQPVPREGVETPFFVWR
jgi:hypothetical protein